MSRPAFDKTGTRVLIAVGDVQYSVPWDTPNNRPINYQGEDGKLWSLALADNPGMTEPDAYDPPVVPATYKVNSTGLARFGGLPPIDVREAVRIATVSRLTKGRYRIGHIEDFGTASYSVTPAVLDAAARTIRVTARTSAYVEVRVTDLAGAAQDAEEVTVKIERVVEAA